MVQGMQVVQRPHVVLESGHGETRQFGQACRGRRQSGGHLALRRGTFAALQVCSNCRACCRLFFRVPPRVEARPQVRDDVGVLGGHVPGFTGIGHDIKEFDLSIRPSRRRHDQFPAVAHGPAPKQTLRRIVEIDERVLVALTEHLSPRGHGLCIEQVHAREPGRWLDTAGREHRGHDVDGACQRVVRSRLNGARPTEHDRAAQAAVVRREFRAGRAPRIVEALDPAVVGDVDDERVRRKVFAVEMVEQVADGTVKPLDVAPITGHVDAVGFCSIVLDEFRGGVVGIVGKHRRIPHEERFSRGPRAADEVLDRLHRLPADDEPFVAVPRAFRHPLRESTARKIPLPPFSGLQTRVAARTEQPRQRGPLLEMPGHPFAARGKRFLAARRVVAHDPVLVRIPAGDDRGEARATEAARHVAAREHEALAGEPIEVRRAQVRVPHERVVAPVLVVRKDEHHVRR